VLILVLLSLTVITLDQSGRTHHLTSGIKSLATDIFSPIRSGVNSILDPIGNVLAGAVHYGSVVQENHELQLELGRLRLQDAASAYQVRQLAELQRLLAENRLPYLDQLPTVLAAETQIGDSNFAATINIDKGRDEGVDVGMPVVGAGGLVGQVTFAAHHAATVTLITDGSSKVGVTFGKGNAYTATLDGQGPTNALNADFVAPGTPVHRGERMFTNGLAGNDFPPGIPVGYVTAARTITGASQETVEVRPLANLDALAYVEVVQWSPSP
jgi:rod shape-determining protein MreC